MPFSNTLAGPSWVLAAIASAMLQFALYDRHGSTGIDWAQLGVAAALAVVVAALPPDRSGRMARAGATICLGSLILAPFVGDAILRALWLGGRPFEIQLAVSLRNMMLGLLAQSGRQRNQQFAALASCFLALFSILWLMNRWTVALMFLYAVVGMWWLMGAYWDRLSGCFLSRSERSIPWKPVCGAAGLGGLAILVLLPLAAGKHYTTAIDGFLPSSGGSRWQDESAYGGVGDGPQMVSTKEDASGFGPIESELFLESKMPSLYDVFNETSEPPPKPKNKGRQRAIPLAPSQSKENHQRRGKNQRPGREFQAVRQRKQPTAGLPDLNSHALLQVAGRTPLHLGLYTYDLWNGRTLASSPGAEPRPLVFDTSDASGRNWVRCAPQGNSDLLPYRERHELRIINLKTDRVPSPPNLTGVHIDLLHTKNLFNSTQDGMLAMDMVFIPQLTVLHVESLRRPPSLTPTLAISASPTAETGDVLAATAREWTAGVTQGWPQVDAICARLRRDFVVDPDALAPEGAGDAAEHFLVETRRGPDYLFATTAALLLRSLGYETRVVSGFYADPENYDRQARITPVYADDAHFWVEVLAASPDRDSDAPGGKRSHWIAIEPTPGYEVLLAPESLWARLFTRAAFTWQVVSRNPLVAIAMCAVVAVAWRKRADAIDGLMTSWWRLRHARGDLRKRVVATVRLLDRRARVRGLGRSAGSPLGRWDLSPQGCRSTALPWEARFRDLANWALYGQGCPPAFSPDEAAALCRSAAADAFRMPRKHRRARGLFNHR